MLSTSALTIGIILAIAVAHPQRPSATRPGQPPDRADPKGTDRAGPPNEISAFVHHIDPEVDPLTVAVIEILHVNADARLPPTWAHSGKTTRLSLSEAQEVLIYLTSPFAWTEAHAACTGDAIVLRLEAADKSLDLYVETHCQHVALAADLAKGQDLDQATIGHLGERAQAFFSELAARIEASQAQPAP